MPFASHKVCRIDWQLDFKAEFDEISSYIKLNNMRVCMHPDQFTIINCLDPGIYEKSAAELVYHSDLMRSLGLGRQAKIQIHVGGMYNDKTASIKRFIARYKKLPQTIKKHLVIENDDRLFSFKDCITIHRETGIPVVLDILHHSLNGGKGPAEELMRDFVKTWQKHDGLPVLDYSIQKKGARKGAHALSISQAHFSRFLLNTKPYDFDIMLEIKDKEKSALKAVGIAKQDKRFYEKN